MYKSARVSSYTNTSSTLSMDDDYASPISGTTHLWLERSNVGDKVQLTIQEHSSGSKGGRRSYTKQIVGTFSKDAIRSMIRHLEQSL